MISVNPPDLATRLLWRAAEAGYPFLRAFKIFETLTHKERLARYGVTPRDRFPVATIALRDKCHDPGCACHVAAGWDGLSGFMRARRRPSPGPWISPIAAMINLGDFASMDDYVAAISPISDGNTRREVARARRHGYETRAIGRNSHLASLAEIQRSKLVRSGGVVNSARATQAARPGSHVDVSVPYEAPRCAEHWRIEFGVFNAADPNRMLAKATLGRSGNLVEIIFFMGHGATLRDGVMKLLMFDMMRWLLESGEPAARGAEYLLYGAVEEGAAGRDKWRRYLGFRPFAVDVARPPERDWLPADFDIAGYFALNPDVRAAGCLPMTHYRQHGVFEGRLYRRPPDAHGEKALQSALGFLPATND